MNNLLWFVAGAIAMKWWSERQTQAVATGQPPPTSPVQSLVQQVFGPQLGPFRMVQPTSPQPACPPGMSSSWQPDANGKWGWSQCRYDMIAQ